MEAPAEALAVAEAPTEALAMAVAPAEALVLAEVLVADLPAVQADRQADLPADIPGLLVLAEEAILEDGLRQDLRDRHLGHQGPLEVLEQAELWAFLLWIQTGWFAARRSCPP